MNKKGFTLIEILIVVSIIGLLASMVLVGLRGVSQRGRDAKRLADLKSIQTGLELYYSANGGYPDDYKTLAGSYGIDKLPTPPTNDPADIYDYCASTNHQQYVLSAHLDDGKNSALKNNPASPSCTMTVTCDNGTNNTATYCVTN